MAANDAPTGEYRKYLPDLSIPRFTIMKEQDAHVYAADFKQNGNPPWLHALWKQWIRLLAEPFKGVTNDGVVRPNLFPIQDEGIPIDDIVSRAKKLLSLLDNEQTRKLGSYHIDDPAWRTWSNPEFLLSDKGLRLDEQTPEIRGAILSVLEATLSPEGYAKAISAMRINGFLGELVQSPRVCNEYSYNFVLFGHPSATSPWGISFYGHHLCLNIFFYRTQLVISPWFTGAEPNEIDAGPHKGTKILRVEESLGLELMQSLSPDQQAVAQVYKQMKDPSMPPGRWNRDDQRHLCGAYRDNRIVPYEGILVSSLPAEAQSLVSQILNEYFLFLPAQARKLRLKQAESFFHETYFCWIGGYESANEVFYYRIQSPVVVVEFDHHSGVFLTNEHPERFHVHTLLRTPNAGDYGVALKAVIPGDVTQDWVWEEDVK
jgi:hypothetical protein